MSQDLLNTHFSSQWSLEITFLITLLFLSLCRRLNVSALMQVQNRYTCLFGTRECQICCSNFCSAALSFAPCSLSLPSISVLLSFLFFLHSRSCLFHRALQSLRINKLYISLCIIPKAPFRKNTQLICPRASVYPKRLHQTWSWWETWPSVLVPHVPELIPIKSTFVFPIEQPGTDPRIRYGEQGEEIYGGDSQRSPRIHFIPISVCQVSSRKFGVLFWNPSANLSSLNTAAADRPPIDLLL